LDQAQRPFDRRTTTAPGVVDLYAALDVVTSKVRHSLTEAHTAIDFLGFIKTVARA
jgi:hypothetical protein